ncbi:acyclic terpene utilization AtuA family protein [Granulosicoccus sp. 3-233]|uniref:acyclic terpene utilization AtuA family protein n=1 Tax=Granulosicoccus sp. 3-233 TaxID=3417969 RepID=UPI003D348EA3
MISRTRVLVPSGVLGLGFDSEALARAVALSPNVICIDGGSTDSGPYSLGTSTSKYSRAVCVREWRQLMQARAALGIPLIIGSSGTCGSDDMVNWMLDITREIAAETGQDHDAAPLKVALLYTEQNKTNLQEQLAQQRIKPLEPAVPLDQAILDSCTHIVALAGAEHIQAALATGADIIIAGRTTDTAVVSALPLARGCHPGACWHAAKIAECGALCSTHPTSGVIVVDIDDTGFTIYPTADQAHCTPHSVSAHMLYENTDPFILYEPGGHLDVREARYEALDDTRVRVTGSRWIPTQPYTVKLEGARLGGFQTTLLALLRSPRYVANARAWVKRLEGHLHREISASLSLSETAFQLDFRLIGENATLGELETQTSTGHETGVLLIITAETQEMANEIGKLSNPFLLHYPLTDDESLPTFAFPYSPAQTARGPLYEFCLNHILELDEPMSAVRLEEVLV